MDKQNCIHATCVGIEGPDGPDDRRGVILRGRSGAGKSDVALQLIDRGARLVADDQVALRVEGGRVVASAPPVLAGLLEVRGLGIVRLDPGALQGQVPIDLIVNVVDPGTDLDRLPVPAHGEILGISIPQIDLAPFEASSSMKVCLAVGVGPGVIMASDQDGKAASGGQKSAGENRGDQENGRQKKNGNR
ncbi:MAG: HPr kinase/phosphorylase [Alphaproteobacteria bacterium]|jgi:HPr kinase/phosphorylase